jgi:hypothetical protein
MRNLIKGLDMAELLKIEYPCSKMRFQRYFEDTGDEIRVFGRCDVTGNEYEIFVDKDLFCAFLNNEKGVSEAMTDDEYRFLADGVSPEGEDILFPERRK